MPYHICPKVYTNFISLGIQYNDSFRRSHLFNSLVAITRPQQRKAVKVVLIEKTCQKKSIYLELFVTAFRSLRHI